MEFAGCCICHDAFSQQQSCVTLHCGHVFDEKCIREWLRIHSNCPSCRARSSLQDLKKIHISLVPVTPVSTATSTQNNDTVQELQTRLDDAILSETLKDWTIGEQQKELETVRIEKETLLEDLKCAELQLEALRQEIEQENTRKARLLSIRTQRLYQAKEKSGTEKTSI